MDAVTTPPPANCDAIARPLSPSLAVIGARDAVDAEVDVLVVGAGGAGLCCAVAAHDAGAQVAVLEKSAKPQGNTMLSSGSIPGAGTRFQRAAGIDDDAARFAADLRRQAGRHENDALVDVLARISAPLVEWLVDEAGVRLELITLYRHVGHRVPRLHAPPSRRGTDLMSDLFDAAVRRGIPVAFGNRGHALLWDRERVRGLETVTRDGARTRIAAEAVVLATNGFAANAALRTRHCPETASLEYAGSAGSEGEAIVWGEALDARLVNMAAYQAHASFAVPHGLLATWTLIELGGVIVDRHGRRIGNESLGYSRFAAVSAGAEAPLHVVYDDRIRARTAAGQQEFAALASLGGVIAAAGVAELAARMGVDETGLRSTLDAARDAARGIGADAFGRIDWGLAPLEPPYAATRVATALLHTQGGLAVDDQARVLRRGGDLVPGLYASGGAAGGISGLTGSGGYTSGNGLLAALGLGLIAGRSAAHAARRGTRRRPEADLRIPAIEGGAAGREGDSPVPGEPIHGRHVRR